MGLPHIDVESIQRAAYQLQAAANSAHQAASRVEESIYKLNALIGEGYGNNFEQVLQLLQDLPQQVEQLKLLVGQINEKASN